MKTRIVAPFFIGLAGILSASAQPLSTEKAYQQRAGQEYRAKNYKAAIADNTQAIKLGPNHFRNYLFRAIVEFDASAEEKALARKEGKTPKSVPKDVPPALAIVPNAVRVREAKRLMTQALLDASKACQLEPKEGECFYLRGRIYAELEGDDVSPNQRKAIADFTRAIELKPKFVPAYRARSRAYYYFAAPDRPEAAKYERLADLDKAQADKLDKSPGTR